MTKQVFSVRVSTSILDNARSCVFNHQGSPYFLTLVGVTESALRRGVMDYEKVDGPPDPIPEGEKPGYIGRRPGISSPPPRSIHSVNIDPSLRESVWRVSYALRIKSEKECLKSISAGKGARPYFEFAIWFEKYLQEELAVLEKKVGKWEVGNATLRAGRRITRTAEPQHKETSVTVERVSKKEAIRRLEESYAPKEPAKEAEPTDEESAEGKATATVKGTYDPETNTYSEDS